MNLKTGEVAKSALLGTIADGAIGPLSVLYPLASELRLETDNSPGGEQQCAVRVSVGASAARTSPQRVELSSFPIGEKAEAKDLSTDTFALIKFEEQSEPLWSERFAIKAEEDRNRYFLSANEKLSQTLRTLDLFDALRSAEAAVRRQRIEWPTATDRAKFRILANRWVEDTEGMSVLSRAFLHRAYQQIIGMGPVAIPLLLEELRDRPEHWMFALSVLSDAEPARGTKTFAGARVAWLRWGEKAGYLNAD